MESAPPNSLDFFQGGLAFASILVGAELILIPRKNFHLALNGHSNYLLKDAYMAKIKFPMLLSICLLAACTSIDKGDRNGVEIWEHFTDINPGKVNNLARNHCRDFGKEAYLERKSDRGFLQSEYDIYYFRCTENTSSVPQRVQAPVPESNYAPATITKPSLSINEASKKCKDLGFDTGTETFGNCVLKLSK